MKNNKNIILVTGATGHQGGAVARHLIKDGTFAVRAMTRDKSQVHAKALEKEGAEVVEGDFNDKESLVKALNGVYGVFSVQNLQNGPEKETEEGKAMADAAKEAKVEHFVYSSVGGAERDSGIPHFESKYKIEEYIRKIGLPYTILRPVFFFYNYDMMRESIDNGTLVQPLDPDTKLQQISEEDYGKMVAHVLGNPNMFKRIEIEVASAAMTMKQVAAAFTKVLGKEVAYQQVSFGDFKKQAGEEMTVMYKWFEKEGYAANFQQLENRFFPLSTLETYLKNHGWG